VMGANNQKLWVQLCKLMGREELVTDPRFTTISQRLAHRAELQEELEQSFRLQGKEYWVATLLANGIPAGPILSYPEAFGSEHAQVRQMRMEIDHPVEGKVPNIGFAVKLSGTPQQVRRHPPLLGEHTEQVLAEAGITGEQMARLRAEGAFGS
jgi:crotonobetainyl-CoA:carnitine CoA-transferase CaiB-like acyl-CoA transferase